MRAKLRACIECGRHIRIAEETCVFCGAAMPASFKVPPERGRPVGNLGRAAVIVMGAAASATAPVVLGACTADVTDPPISAADAYGLPPPEAGPDRADVISVADAYGLPFDARPDARDGGDGGDASDGAKE